MDIIEFILHFVLLDTGATSSEFLYYANSYYLQSKNYSSLAKFNEYSFNNNTAPISAFKLVYNVTEAMIVFESVNIMLIFIPPLWIALYFF